MSNHQIGITSGGGIDPETLTGVTADDSITITNQSGAGASITYPAGANPFSDVTDGSSEPLANGAHTTHTIKPDFDPLTTYELDVRLLGSMFRVSPKIRITGTTDS